MGKVMSYRSTATMYSFKDFARKNCRKKRETSAVLSVCCLVWKWSAVSRTHVRPATALSLLLENMSWICSQVRFARSVVRTAGMCEDVTALSLAKTHCCRPYLSPIYQFIYLLTTHPPTRPSLRPSARPTVCLPACLPACYLSIYLI